MCSSDRVPPTSWMSASHGCQAPRGNPDTRRSSGHSASTGALPLLPIRRAGSQPSRLAARAAAYQRRPYPCSDPFKHRRDATNTAAGTRQTPSLHGAPQSRLSHAGTAVTPFPAHPSTCHLRCAAALDRGGPIPLSNTDGVDGTSQPAAVTKACG